ncbi:GNAT family N-acetyltransferase [Thiococcus pfennigii]|uniref:GNAT family N-acetyltransferase n=1 Tax=Thiococcus pfennigii TaxID=1057 RepID=UPI0019069079|nr:GNAT family N-acetyltransferase [Thiococcus pfennigii]MBK1733353.1 GNAT family N-acetyltransferase [Thiococcus pfennigii]
MTGVFFCTEPLGGRSRGLFCCGVDALDRYFHRQVSQDIRRRLTACYVALCGDSERICGFYTLSACHIALPDLPAEITRKLPPYPVIPAVRIGRLAVDRDFRGQGLGSAMLVDAARRVIESDIAAFALIVDAKDAQAVAFYEHHGFLRLAVEGEARTLFIPLKGIAARLKQE